MMRRIGEVRWATEGEERDEHTADEGNTRGVMGKPKPLKRGAGWKSREIRAAGG